MSKTYRLLYHSALGSRVIKKKKVGGAVPGCLRGGGGSRRRSFEREQLEISRGLPPAKWLKPRPESGADCLTYAIFEV